MALLTGSIRQNQLSDFSALRNYFDYKFYDNIFYSEGGFTFEDAFELYFASKDSYLKAEFGGTGVIFSDGPNGPLVSGGAFTGIKLKEWNGSDWKLVYAGTGFSASAKQLYNAIVSATTSDDKTLIQAILSGNDRFELSNLDDVAYGFDGNDQLFGGNGSDYLDGGKGADTIIGQAGGDQLKGGANNDTFRYSSLSESRLAAHDRIIDFVIGSDLLDAPQAVPAAKISKLGKVSSLKQDKIAATLTNSNFKANQAATFTVGSGAATRTFLALNDNTAGFDHLKDSLIEITGYIGKLTNLSII